ncbi:MAG: FadR/GntR family transcriptional regulator [Armatimonadota bacterium]|nr:FadR/GntR family transcriptional regulator [Armatimonadota bacterium]MDR7452233.1 FadR/GntR family transcriptional regulator [Armatimonadota bacterium]MDR7466672.1 FadR/GntR family transcriptional regulator [Armatimonadota bacterium]MDR7492854.1 FadR/GntR family transcriptional regulator [Armatimonadota bacterium]MDR7498630.1 FadR/GntR family transcriptional regulator [Armatimonadota bacterium]
MEAPIERRKVYELLAERLLTRIGERHLRPGDPLPTERELTRLYRVGRSSVREALRMLESKGLIKPVGTGAFVVAEYTNPFNDSLNLLLTLKETSLRELFEVRKILEVEAAALAAARRTAADLEAMGRAVEEMEAGLASADRYIAADLRFHLTVARATGNKVAVHLMHAIRGVLQEALASIYRIPGSPQQSIIQHRGILAAIASGDAADARWQMWQHLARVERDIEEILAGSPAGRGSRRHAAGGGKGARRG